MKILPTYLYLKSISPMILLGTALLTASIASHSAMSEKYEVGTASIESACGRISLVSVPRGILVLSLDTRAQLGIYQGDKLLSIDGVKISTPESLMSKLRSSDKSVTHSISLQRNGVEKSITTQSNEWACFLTPTPPVPPKRAETPPVPPLPPLPPVSSTR